MMSEHTPGPWYFGHWGDHFWVGPDRTGQTGKIAGAVWGMGEVVEAGRANARLIAAAPDLLEAVKTAIESAVWRHQSHCVCEVCEQMRAAIAKAEGTA